MIRLRVKTRGLVMLEVDSTHDTCRVLEPATLELSLFLVLISPHIYVLDNKLKTNVKCNSILVNGMPSCGRR